jgi:DNA-binding phage protein
VGGISDTKGGRRKAVTHRRKPVTQKIATVALTQDSRQTIVERIARDPEFARALLDEAATLFLNGEPDTARLILRDLVAATVGFEELAAETTKPAKSLHRMLSKAGNPTMDSFAAILAVVRKKLRVDLRAHSVAAA